MSASGCEDAGSATKLVIYIILHSGLRRTPDRRPRPAANFEKSFEEVGARWLGLQNASNAVPQLLLDREKSPPRVFEKPQLRAPRAKVSDFTCSHAAAACCALSRASVRGACHLIEPRPKCFEVAPAPAQDSQGSAPTDYVMLCKAIATPPFGQPVGPKSRNGPRVFVHNKR